MKCALVRPDGIVHHAERHPTDAARGPEAVVANILDVAAGLADRARADGLAPVAAGIAVPGVVDEDERRRGLVVERGLPRRTAAGSGLRPARRARRARPRRARRRHGRGPPRRRPRPAARALHRHRHRHRRRARGRRQGVRRRARRGRRGRPRHRAARRPAVRLRRPRLPGVGGLGRPRSAAATPSCPASPARPRSTSPPGPPPASRWPPRSGRTRSRRWPTACSPPRRSTTPGSWCSAAAWPRPARRCCRRCGSRSTSGSPSTGCPADPGRARRHGRLPGRRPARAWTSMDDDQGQRPDRPPRRGRRRARGDRRHRRSSRSTPRGPASRTSSCPASWTCTATAAAGTPSPPARRRGPAGGRLPPAARHHHDAGQPGQLTVRADARRPPPRTPRWSPKA